MKMSIDEFRRKYPHLAREILDGEGLGIALEIESDKPVLDDPWRGYLPGVVDYLRRCKTVDEAFQVLDYMEKHGEITREEAEKYRSIIREHGLEYFGPRKEDDYYYKTAVKYWRKQLRKQKTQP